MICRSDVSNNGWRTPQWHSRDNDDACSSSLSCVVWWHFFESQLVSSPDYCNDKGQNASFIVQRPYRDGTRARFFGLILSNVKLCFESEFWAKSRVFPWISLSYKSIIFNLTVASHAININPRLIMHALLPQFWVSLLSRYEKLKSPSLFSGSSLAYICLAACARAWRSEKITNWLIVSWPVMSLCHCEPTEFDEQPALRLSSEQPALRFSSEQRTSDCQQRQQRLMPLSAQPRRQLNGERRLLLSTSGDSSETTSKKTSPQETQVLLKHNGTNGTTRTDTTIANG